MKTKPDIVNEVRSYMKSRVILSASELDFFSKLDDNFMSAEDLAGYARPGYKRNHTAP